MQKYDRVKRTAVIKKVNGAGKNPPARWSEYSVTFYRERVRVGRTRHYRARRPVAQRHISARRRRHYITRLQQLHHNRSSIGRLEVHALALPIQFDLPPPKRRAEFHAQADQRRGGDEPHHAAQPLPRPLSGHVIQRMNGPRRMVAHGRQEGEIGRLGDGETSIGRFSPTLSISRSPALWIISPPLPSSRRADYR